MPTLNINNDDIRLNSSSSDKVVVNGNLGIGTTSPGAKLTIGPSFATTNGFTIDTADSSHSQIIARKTSSKTAFGLLAWDTSVFLSAGIYYEGGAWVQNNHNGTNQLFNLTPGSGARWYASNNGSGSWNVSSDVQLWDDAAIWTSLVRSTRAGDSYFTGGNVGIGTTSPGYKLDVVAGANSTYPFIVRNAGNAEIGGIYSTSGGAGQIYLFNASTVATVKISTIDSSYFTGGNVGIGTTSPTNKLEVGDFLDAATNAIIVSARYEYEPEFIFRLGQSGTNLDWKGAIISSGDDGNYNGKILFKTANVGRDAPTTKMVIKANGNVGIATTNPGYKLDVVGESRFGSLTKAIVGSDGTYSGYSTIGFGGTSDGYNRVFASGGAGDGLYLAAATGQGIDFWTNGFPSSRMYINASGNVGIGTTSPTSKFTVTNGNVEIQSNGASSMTNYLKIATHTNGSWGSFIAADSYYNSTLSTNLTLGVSNAGSALNVLHITSAGNVGIGTTSPTAKLAISSGSSNGLRIDTNSGGYAALNIGGTGTLTVDAPMITGGRFQVLDNGNVGIGVPSPSEKLHVDGNVIVTYNNSFQGINSIGNKAILARVSPTTGIINYAEYATATNLNGFVLGSDDARVKGDIATDSLDFITNTSSRMFINSSGNVGIATTSPSYKLDVVGDSRITSGSLGVGVAPNATDGRIDASNDIVAYSTSDQRLKENVTPIENALEKVKTLTGVKFDWKEETAHVHGYHGHDVGIIAQDVQAVLPEAVRTNESGYLSVRYEKMIALLIEANKELAARVEFLEQKLKQ